MKRAWVLGLLTAVVAGLVACSDSAPPERPETGAPRPTHAVSPEEDPSPPDEGVEFTVTTFEGDRFSMREQRGTPVVLNFWESW